MHKKYRDWDEVSSHNDPYSSVRLFVLMACLYMCLIIINHQ